MARNRGAASRCTRPSGDSATTQRMRIPTNGPHDGDTLAPEITPAPGTVDFGAVRVPVPAGGTVSVEPTTAGRIQAVHVTRAGGAAVGQRARRAPHRRAVGRPRHRDRRVAARGRRAGAVVHGGVGPGAARDARAGPRRCSSGSTGRAGCCTAWPPARRATRSARRAAAADAAGHGRGARRRPYPVRTVLPLTVPDHLPWPDLVPVPRIPTDRLTTTRHTSPAAMSRARPRPSRPSRTAFEGMHDESHDAPQEPARAWNAPGGTRRMQDSRRPPRHPVRWSCRHSERDNEHGHRARGPADRLPRPLPAQARDAPPRPWNQPPHEAWRGPGGRGRRRRAHSGGAARAPSSRRPVPPVGTNPARALRSGTQHPGAEPAPRHPPSTPLPRTAKRPTGPRSGGCVRRQHYLDPAGPLRGGFAARGVPDQDDPRFDACALRTRCSPTGHHSTHPINGSVHRTASLHQTHPTRTGRRRNESYIADSPAKSHIRSPSRQSIQKDQGVRCVPRRQPSDDMAPSPWWQLCLPPDDEVVAQVPARAPVAEKPDPQGRRHAVGACPDRFRRVAPLVGARRGRLGRLDPAAARHPRGAARRARPRPGSRRAAHAQQACAPRGGGAGARGALVGAAPVRRPSCTGPGHRPRRPGVAPERVGPRAARRGVGRHRGPGRPGRHRRPDH